MEGPLSPAGRLRIGVSPSVWIADSRFGRRTVGGETVEEVEPLGFDLSAERLGSATYPPAAGLRDALREALSDPDYTVSLGRSRVRIQETRIRVPLRLDMGITDWLTVGATVPFVKRRSEMGILFVSDSATADVGPNPAAISPGSVDLFLQGLSGAVDAMAAEADALCATSPGSADCDGARAAARDGRSFLQALSGAYAGPFFPHGSSDAGRGLRTRLGSLAERFASYGVTSVPDPGSLPLAQGPLGEGGLQRLATDPAFGVVGDSLGTWESPWEMGDVEVHAAVRLLELGAPDPGRITGRPGLMVGVGGLVRLGTGVPDDPDNFQDLGSGDGQMDVEGRAFADLDFGGRLGVWLDARYGVQMEGELPRRVAPPSVVLAPAASRIPVTWDPGDYLELALAPRWRLTPELAVAARYRFFHETADGYALAGPVGGGGLGTEPPDPTLLEAETRKTLHEAGVGIVYSTLAASRAGETGAPLEARLRYRRAVAGSGGQVRKASRFEAGLRLFWRIWGD